MFERVAHVFSAASAGRFHIVYGCGVEDVFIHADGTEVNIERALQIELQSQGYRRVVYSMPHRPLFFLDERSASLTWQSNSSSSDTENQESQKTRVGSGPFGPRMLKSHSPAPPPPDYSRQGIGDTSLIGTEAESALIGKPLTDETFDVALEALLGQVGFRSSARRASADYRRHIVTGLFRDVLGTAWERAK